MRTPTSIRRLLLPLALLLLPVAAPAQTASAPGAATTTVLFVRHAEKASDDARNPSLSAQGQARAEALRAALADADVTAIYATQYRRTAQTAEPLAAALGVSIVQRPIDAANAATYPQALRQEILDRHAGQAVLVVGHSNTVPELVRAFSGSAVDSIPDAVYDRIYVVSLPPSGPARRMLFRYGAPTP
jgi:broad specificity phosphatase PhoE